MPTYEYRCQNGHTFEVTQSMSDDPVEKCQICGAPVERVFHPIAVHFKGSGFYTTDYGRNRSGASSDSGSKDEQKGEAAKGETAKTEAAGSKSESSSSDTGSSSGSSSD